MITSVLNMIARDTRKLILACMRFDFIFNTLFYGPISRFSELDVIV